MQVVSRCLAVESSEGERRAVVSPFLQFEAQMSFMMSRFRVEVWSIQSFRSPEATKEKVDLNLNGARVPKVARTLEKVVCSNMSRTWFRCDCQETTVIGKRDPLAVRILQSRH